MCGVSPETTHACSCTIQKIFFFVETETAMSRRASAAADTGSLRPVAYVLRTKLVASHDANEQIAGVSAVVSAGRIARKRNQHAHDVVTVG